MSFTPSRISLLMWAYSLKATSRISSRSCLMISGSSLPEIELWESCFARISSFDVSSSRTYMTGMMVRPAIFAASTRWLPETTVKWPSGYFTQKGTDESSPSRLMLSTNARKSVCSMYRAFLSMRRILEISTSSILNRPMLF